MSYVLIVVSPEKVAYTSPEFQGLASHLPACAAELEPVASSKDAVVATTLERRRIKRSEVSEIRSVRVDALPAEVDRNAFAELAKQVVRSQDVSEREFHWDVVTYDTPMFSFVALVISVMPVGGAPRRHWWKPWS